MSTPLHSEKSLLLQTQVTALHMHAQAFATRQLPMTLTLAAMILSVLGVKA